MPPPVVAIFFVDGACAHTILHVRIRLSQNSLHSYHYTTYTRTLDSRTRISNALSLRIRFCSCSDLKCTIDLGRTGKMNLGKAARKLKRIGKTAYQFRVTSTFEYVELSCSGTWWVGGLAQKLMIFCGFLTDSICSTVLPYLKLYSLEQHCVCVRAS